MPDESKQEQLIPYAKMLTDGLITAADYQRHKADIVGDGEDIQDPDLAAIRSTLEEERDEATRPPESSKTNEEWERYTTSKKSQPRHRPKLLSSHPSKPGWCSSASSPSSPW